MLAALVFPGWLPALAQSPAAELPSSQSVEIVGSHLKRVEEEGPTPISIYRRREIDESGATLLSEFLLTLPIAGAGGFDDRANILSFHTGTAALSLRGVGPGATLILLNGRRIVPYGLALASRETYVDLNSLPLAAIDRIEVLRDGASAIYGADAIGGVVNIVLRHDFRGAEASLLAARSSRGDASKRYASASLGLGELVTDGYNAFVVFDVLKRDSVPMTARTFSASADQRPRGGPDLRSTGGVPPSVQLPGQPTMAGPGCPADRIVTSPFGGASFCVFDTRPFMDLLPQEERLGLVGVVSLALPGESKMYAELVLNRTRTAHGIAPTPYFAMVPAAAPTNPYGTDAFVFSRLTEAEPRRSEPRIDFIRAVVGAQGHWQRWEWDLSAGANRIRTAYKMLSHPLSDVLQQRVEAGTLDPFGPNDPAALIGATANAIDRFTGSASFVLAKATAELARLDHGPLAAAGGVEGRRERFRTELGPLIRAGSENENERGDRSISAAFLELAWPAARGVELQLAARHDRYSDFGDATSPKIAASWQPLAQLLLRASAGRGFLTPTLQQLTRPLVSGFSPSPIDPIRCPVTQSQDDCGGGLIMFTEQGNPQLKAERSRQYNAGLVFEPSPGLAVSLDFWRIDDIGKIQSVGNDYILRHESEFPGFVVRAIPSAQDLAAGLPGPIVELHLRDINVASRDVRGIDLELKDRLAWPGLGTGTLSAMVSYSERHVERITPESQAEDKAGTSGRPRLRGQLGASLKRGPWQFGAQTRFIGRYHTARIADGSRRNVGSWLAVDLDLGWEDQRDWVLLVIRNVADRQPPLFDTGYDASVHEPIGRYMSLSWRRTF